MSPVENRTNAATIRAVLVLAFALIALAALVIWILGSGDGDGVEFQLGDDTFDAGDAGNLRATIDAGGPVLFADASGSNNDIIIQHVGDDLESGWLAFAARPTGTERPCTIGWRADSEDFQLGWNPRDEVLDSSCSGDTFPADGAGLEPYNIYLEEDGDNFDVIVDFRDPEEIEEELEDDADAEAE